MAATTINVQAIQDSINSANKYLEEQNSSIAEISTTINSISYVWEAEDQRVYDEQFKTTQKKIETFNSGVQKSLEAMKTFVNDCVAIDAQTAKALRNVSW